MKNKVFLIILVFGIIGISCASAQLPANPWAKTEPHHPEPQPSSSAEPSAQPATFDNNLPINPWAVVSTPTPASAPEPKLAPKQNGLSINPVEDMAHKPF